MCINFETEPLEFTVTTAELAVFLKLKGSNLKIESCSPYNFLINDLNLRSHTFHYRNSILIMKTKFKKIANECQIENRESWFGFQEGRIPDAI